MKVLHFFKTYYPETYGGVEEVIYQLAENSPRYGVDAQVLALSRKGSVWSEQYHNHTVHRSRTNFYFASTSFSLSAFRDFAALARDVDVVHYHFPWPFMDLVHFASRIRKPSIVTYHSDIVKQQTLLRLYEPLQNKFLTSVDRIVATSPNYAVSSSVLSRFKNKVSVIPIGIEDAFLSVVPERETLEAWRARLPEKFFLFIGALRYYKGLSYLLEAAHTARYPIVIAGTGPDEAKLKAKARALGLDKVFFIGAVSSQDKSALLRLCYAFVFPSHIRSEAFGIALLEAAMHGKSMISCEIGTGTSYVNIDGITGLTIPGANSGSLALAMQTLWSEPEKAVLYGKQARHRYLSLFTADAMTGGYARLYQTVVHLPSC